jgi:hypothetical protein
MTATPNTGERWIVRLRPIGSSEPAEREETVTLIDFDPRTDAWTVRPDGAQEAVALAAADLIRRAD